MATFVKLTERKGEPIWINLDLVRTMDRLPAFEGDRYADQHDDGTWTEKLIGARPERTRLSFGETAHGGDDSVEVLETPEELLALITTAARGEGSSDAP